MIKVNLLKDLGSGGGGQQEFNVPSGKRLSLSGSNVDIGVKFFIALIPLILVIGYETYSIGKKELDLQAQKDELEKTKKRMNELRPELNAVRKFQKEKDDLQKKIDTIKQLSSARLRNVKALDALQDIIPAKAWITELVFQSSNVTIKGKAIEDLVVSEFMLGLEQSIFFSNVQLKATRDDRSKEGVVKSYEISCQLENL